ncbi:Fc.00g000940.m01.CDS01 [Cosmosporella sp. VM-42]
MTFRSLTSKILATSVLVTVTAAGTYGFAVSRRIAPADRKQITIFDDIPHSLKQSNTVKNIVNARNHEAMADSRFITINIPARLREVSDEVLLAKFVKGFFGGLVIAPERIALQTVKMDLVHFKALKKTMTPVWSTSELSQETLPSLHAVLFGVFQVSDVQLASQKALVPPVDGTESHIDFCFGSDRAQFAGVHRFSIVRTHEDSDDGEMKVQVHCQSMSCNPTGTKRIGPAWMFTFHKMYAQLLFREGVSEIKRWFNEYE